MSQAPAEPLSAPAPAGPKLLGPFLVGFFMLLTIFMMANPSFGTRLDKWPWEVFSETAAFKGDQLRRMLVLVWSLTGAWLLFGSMVVTARTHATVSAVLVGVLLLQCSSEIAGFSIDRYALQEFVPLILLAAGALHILARPGTSTGRWLILFGLASWLLYHLHMERQFVTIDGNPDGRVIRTNLLQGVLHEAGAWFSGVDISAYRERPNYVSMDLLPRLSTLGGVTLSLIAALGLRLRALLWAAVGLIAIGIFMPMEERVRLEIAVNGWDFPVLVDRLVEGFISHGTLLWLAGVFTLGNLLRTRRA